MKKGDTESVPCFFEVLFCSFFKAIGCSFIPCGEKRKAKSVKRKEIPFMTYLSTLHPKPNALRYTLYAK